MTDNEIIKALERIAQYSGFTDDVRNTLLSALDLINRQQAEIDRLELVLLGVMHSVDKWLDDDELKQDEVSRATTMREKTLQIMEKQQVEIEQWKEEANRYQRLWCIAVDDIETAKSEAIQEFAERLKKEIDIRPTHSNEQNKYVCFLIDNLVKEIVGDTE